MGNTTDSTMAGESTSGQEFPLESVLSVFEGRTDQARPLTANDVMEELGCSRRTAHNKLNALVKRNTLATRKVGARGRVWWVPLTGITRDDSAKEHETYRDPEVNTGIADAELPGSGETLEKRRGALRAAYDYLSRNPNATESEFLVEVFPEHPAGYKTADKWWEAIEPALRELPNVDVNEDREHVWHYVGG
ncbi:ArsR family transcriptional regulator [Halobaculum sp. EA56]|uniref:ArsR family transcriptional regulator n=1 Tax=Halobaculum sp. EA56 TaxID=3421648 RepID=UPI003EBD0660